MDSLLNRIKQLTCKSIFNTAHWMLRQAYEDDLAYPGEKFSDETIMRNLQNYGGIDCHVGKKIIKVPIQNEFGKCYPAYATDVVHELFNLKEDDVVVDIGGAPTR